MLLYILSCVVMFIILLARFFIARTIISHIRNFRYKDKLANANLIPLLGGFTVIILWCIFESGTSTGFLFTLQLLFRCDLHMGVPFINWVTLFDVLHYLSGSTTFIPHCTY